ncbi:MAG: hypothetical protein FJZ94_02615 [Chloroflexi bacterium]|nr:hypothetical protein [Chloroflexota bacterium]
MNKLFKVGIAVLAAVAVLVVGLGTGIALAKGGKEIQTLAAPSVAYDPEYTCPNCPGFQNGNCPYAGNCGGYCSGQGGGCRGGWTSGSTGNVPACHRGTFTASASNQPRCGGCWR